MKKILRRVALLTLVAFGAIAQQTCNNGLGGGGNGLPSGGSVGQCLVNTAPGAGGWNSCATGAVSTTGSPAAGELTKFSAAATITNGNLAGDCTTSNSLTVTCLETNSVAFGTFTTQSYASPPIIGDTTPAAGHFTTLSASSASFTAASGVALTATGISGQNAAALQGNTTTGNSYGLQIKAGTNSTDDAFFIQNAAGSTTLAVLNGDGGLVLGSPTGGDKGLGTINVTGCYLNGVARDTGGGGVSSFSGDGSLISNSASTGAVTATLANTGVGYGVWGNIGSSSAAPAYHALSTYPTAAFPTLNQNTTGSAASLTALTGMPSQAANTIIGNCTSSSAVPTACTLAGNLAMASGVLETSQPINAQTGTTYAMLTSDAGKLLTFSNASSVAVSLSVATTTGFTSGYSFDVQNLGAGTVTITPTTSTINGVASLSLAQNQGCTITSDGTNYQVSACTALISGGGGSGTVGSGAAGQVGYYASSGTTISGLTLGNNFAITSGTIHETQPINSQSGTTYTMLTTDLGKQVIFTSASAVAVTLPVATTTGFGVGYWFDVQTVGAGTVTITPTLSTVNGSTALVLSQSKGCRVRSDGTNYQVSACTALISSSPVFSVIQSGTNTQTLTMGTGGTLTFSGSGVNNASEISGTTPTALQLAILAAGTTFTIAPTGCTPSAHAGGPFGGTISLASGPCTSIVVTLNGATGFTDSNGYDCSVGDQTAQNAGTWIPKWGQSAQSSTTVTIPIPAAAGATDVISFHCTPN